MGKEAEGGRKLSLERGLERIGRSKVLFKGSALSEPHLPSEGSGMGASHEGGWVGVGLVLVQEEETAAPPHCTVTSRQRLPFFLQLSLPFPPPPRPWMTLTAKLLSLNLTENLEGEQTERQS